MDARVQPPVMECEMVDVFSGTLQGQYYMSYSNSDSFAEMVTYGENIEVGIKLGKIQDVSRTNAGNVKKSFGGYKKKEKTKSSALYAHCCSPKFPLSCFPRLSLTWVVSYTCLEKI